MLTARNNGETPVKYSAMACVSHLVKEYRRFLRTSYRFLDDHLRRQFEEHLAQAEVVVKGPYVTLARDFQKGATLKELVAEGRLDGRLLAAHWPFGEEALYRHQEQGLEAGRAGHCFIITTGTGSGKTESFLLPVLDGILRRKDQGVTGVQAVFLYPMNALANDQLERLRRLLRETGLDLSFALYTGDSDTASQRLSEAPAETERQTRADIRRRPPDILLTNYKQLEFILVRKADRELFTPALKYLVLDEVHAYRGALATEIACLIRRLKAHAGLTPGKVICIGTSATVASGEGGVSRLAKFATDLYGEDFQEEYVIGETLEPQSQHPEEARWVPSAPHLGADEILELDSELDESIVTLAQRLTGRICPSGGHVSRRIAEVLQGNAVVETLEAVFSLPNTINAAAQELQQRFPDRPDLDDNALEVEAYLLVGSVGDEDHPPRLRPKLHTFFHGVYDVALCLNPDCRTLVPQGGEECPRCGSVARPAALCRTCGQDFVKLRLEKQGDDRPVGTSDFFSDENTIFLTHRIHELPESPGLEDEDEEEPLPDNRRRRREAAAGRLQGMGFCPGCGRIMPAGQGCPVCNRASVSVLMHQGKLHKCPACGDIYTRGDIVTPMSTGKASSVAVMTTHHLDHLEDKDRRLLVFADNRQDAAHQAGYTADKHRSFSLRHLMAHEVRGAGDRGIYIQELPERLFDHYRQLGIIPQRPTRMERERWLVALTYLVANEFSRYSRQRASLENLGLVAVDYEFLNDLVRDQRFLDAASQAGLEVSTGLVLTRAALDIMRKNRALAYPFFQEYLDPNRKRQYRELEAEPYNIRFPDRDRSPKAFALNRPDHIRRQQHLKGFYQENPRAGQLTAVEKVVVRLVGDRERARHFLQTVVPLLQSDDIGILENVSHFPLPRGANVQGLRPLQISPRVIRLTKPEAGYKCNACQTWRPYYLPTCPTPRCQHGALQPVEVDEENYYVSLYLNHSPRRLAIAEHSAQIPGEERAKRESDFKDGRLDVMVCTPTLELGVDIGPLLTILLRNAPPTPANYIQRVGRAGRRLRIGFVSTFCAGGTHDRHAFENPEWLVAGQFDPPGLRLNNPFVVQRHLRSYILECLDFELPRLMGDLLDNLRTPSRWKTEDLESLYREIQEKRQELVFHLSELFASDRDAQRTDFYGPEFAEDLVAQFKGDLSLAIENWWRRVYQLDQEFHEYSTIGSSRHDIKKAAARARAYYEITQDKERAYTLNFLSTQGLLPAYQFPVDTFSLDPGVDDTPTLYRPAAIAIEEFAPGNFVYANGHKLRSIRVLFAGGPGAYAGGTGRSDAETSGRLSTFQFCPGCEEMVEETRNTCPNCQRELGDPVEAVFVNAFEAEESLRIGSDEEARERRYHLRRESILPKQEGPCQLFPYPLTPVEFRHLSEILITNWGRIDPLSGEGSRFWLCPDCGRHQPYEPSNPAHAGHIEKWQNRHAKFCSGQPAPLILAYRFHTDCLILSLRSNDIITQIGRWSFSPTLVTLAEALLIGAQTLLELEPYELNTFTRNALQEGGSEQIVIYETVPGGAGYVEEIARRLPEVAQAAQERLYGHQCAKACYLCLKHYRNQKWHSFFDKDRVRDVLAVLAQHEPVEQVGGQPGIGLETLSKMVKERNDEFWSGGASDPQTGRYRKGHIEEILKEALERTHDLPLGIRDLEIKDGDRLITVPDFAWEDIKLAIYCDGFSFHGNQETLELDAKKRNWLQSQGWVVLTYWGRTILKNPAACAKEIAQIYHQRRHLLS
jgi:ATP-dependent helicase YprA (DUF1998 family)/RNA polymerase subunit RPABC4/transcription elongation factor Spt4